LAATGPRPSKIGLSSSRKAASKKLFWLNRPIALGKGLLLLLSQVKGKFAMGTKFLELTVTGSVREAQEHYYGKSRRFESALAKDELTEEEVNFIQTRDSFYMATVTESGWPYLQHRGGKPGFLRVISPSTIAFADYKGNRQLLSTGNVAANDRVALFLMDYPQRTRLKILGHARLEDAREHPELVAQLAEPDAHRIVERLFFIEVELSPVYHPTVYRQ
jgi:uncharacterized protein